MFLLMKPSYTLFGVNTKRSRIKENMLSEAIFVLQMCLLTFVYIHLYVWYGLNLNQTNNIFFLKKTKNESKTIINEWKISSNVMFYFSSFILFFNSINVTFILVKPDEWKIPKIWSGLNTNYGPVWCEEMVGRRYGKSKFNFILKCSMLEQQSINGWASIF